MAAQRSAGEPTTELEPRSAARLTFLNSHNCVKHLSLLRTETEKDENIGAVIEVGFCRSAKPALSEGGSCTPRNRSWLAVDYYSPQNASLDTIRRAPEVQEWTQAVPEPCVITARDGTRTPDAHAKRPAVSFMEDLLGWSGGSTKCTASSGSYGFLACCEAGSQAKSGERLSSGELARALPRRSSRRSQASLTFA